MTTEDQAFVSQIVAAIHEFHSTTDAKRRSELDRALREFQKSDGGFKVAFSLLDFTQPTIIQHFGACTFYDTIREKWDKCVAEEAMMNQVKDTLLEKLALGAPFMNQSVTNKLTSSLGIFALSCMPDIWPQAIQDLAIVWADKPELLLRVLAEIAAEFHRVQLPLDQRSNLKSCLHQKAQDVIKIVNVVLCDSDASPSLRNAAVDCLEQWLKLPGVDLSEWQPALLPFLGNISDRAALARVLNVVSGHPNLPLLECIGMDLCTFIANVTCQAIADQLQDLARQRKTTGSRIEHDDYIAELEDFSYLISALAAFVESVMRSLLLGAVEKRNMDVLKVLCSFFEKVSTWEGIYPLDEVISDAPESFWYTLKDDIQSIADSRVTDTMRNEIISECSSYYVRLLWSSISKLSYPPLDVYNSFDKEQIEKFEKYRQRRIEVALNAFSLSPEETNSVLVWSLEEAFSRGDICRAEAVLYLFDRVADYMSEQDVPTIIQTLELCARIREMEFLGDVYGASQFGKSLMRLLHSLSHLISTSPHADKLDTICIELALAFIGTGSSTEEALKTLEKFLADRDSRLDVMERVIQKCYDYFMQEEHPKPLRLAALKCVGISLSLNDNDYILESLKSILAPRVRILQMIVEGQIANTSQSSEDLEGKCLFELGVLSVLIASQKPKLNAENSKRDEKPAAYAVLQQCLPFLLILLKNFGFSGLLVEKITDVLRSGLIAARNGILPIIGSYYDVLEFIILEHPAAFNRLAKTLLLLCSDTSALMDMSARAAGWFRKINAVTDEYADDHVELAYHMVKKGWKLLSESQTTGRLILHELYHMSIKILAFSNDTSVCRKSAVLLATIIRNSIDKDAFMDLLQEAGERILSVAFSRLQSELIKSTTEILAEILMLFARNYPNETRQCISALPNGNSPQVLNMLKETHNARMFKQLALQFNSQRRKERDP